MADAADTIVLALLHRIDERTERMEQDLQDVNTRLTALAEMLAGMAELNASATGFPEGAVH